MDSFVSNGRLSQIINERPEAFLELSTICFQVCKIASFGWPTPISTNAGTDPVGEAAVEPIESGTVDDLPSFGSVLFALLSGNASPTRDRRSHVGGVKAKSDKALVCREPEKTLRCGCLVPAYIALRLSALYPCARPLCEVQKEVACLMRT